MKKQYDINDPNIQAAIDKWNSLTRVQKIEFGDRFITHESNLEAWNKEFGDLSGHKMEVVVKNILHHDLPNQMIV